MNKSTRRVFRSSDSLFEQYNDLEVANTAPLDPNLYDENETGPMLEVTLSNGVKVQAFADEIVEVN